MKLSDIILALSAIVASFCCYADEPVKNAHQNAHRNRHIAKNTPAINAAKDIPALEFENSLEVNDAAGSFSPSANNRIIDDVLKEAYSHMGKPYLHGAKGPSKFDCSGFSSYVYRQFGYTISAGSRIQATEGVPVAKGDLRKGDLVFFTSRSSGGKVGHVGIVVDADNSTGKFSFIHASVKGVRVNECEGYYKQRYLFARRIIAE